MDISEYIKNHEKLSHLPYMIVYMVIMTLMDDGFVMQNVD